MVQLRLTNFNNFAPSDRGCSLPIVPPCARCAPGSSLPSSTLGKSPPRNGMDRKMADDVVDPSRGRPAGRKPEQPPTDWMPGMNDTSNQVVQIHREVARRSAVTGVRASTMPPPLATAFAGEGTLVADGQVVEAARATRRR